MYPFRRLALLLALSLAPANLLVAQSSSSSSNPASPQDQGQAQQPPASQNPGQVNVQARIRARRDQRRAQAIHDAYTHLYDVYVGMGYLRFSPGPTLQRVTYYSWDAELTRYYTQRLGVTAGGRGYYGTPFVGVNFSGITRPAVSTYAVMGGPTYRFYMQPKYSISGRVMGGWALGNFTGDTNGFGSIQNASGTGTLLWKDGSTYAVTGGLIGEYNISPNLALRLGGEYFGTGFDSTMQNSVGFTSGFVYRFGKQ